MHLASRSPISPWLLLGALALTLGAPCRTPAAAPPVATPAGGDQPVYADSFRSGWVNYGWATIDPANTGPVRRGTASLKISSGGFDGLHLHHSALDTRLYRALTFWISGGPHGPGPRRAHLHLPLPPLFGHDHFVLRRREARQVRALNGGGFHPVI